MGGAVFLVSLMALPLVLAIIVAGCLANAFRKDALPLRTRAVIAAVPFPTTLLFAVVLAVSIGPGVTDNGPQIIGGLMIMGIFLLLVPLLYLTSYITALRILKDAR